MGLEVFAGVGKKLEFLVKDPAPACWKLGGFRCRKMGFGNRGTLGCFDLFGCRGVSTGGARGGRVCDGNTPQAGGGGTEPRAARRGTEVPQCSAHTRLSPGKGSSRPSGAREAAKVGFAHREGRCLHG